MIYTYSPIEGSSSSSNSLLPVEELPSSWPLAGDADYYTDFKNIISVPCIYHT